jgi:hypothetical protein
MTKGTRLSFLNQHIFHHLDQLIILKNLLHNMRVWFSIKLSVWKATFSTHRKTPLNQIITLLFFLNKNVIINLFEIQREGEDENDYRANSFHLLRMGYLPVNCEAVASISDGLPQTPE